MKLKHILFLLILAISLVAILGQRIVRMNQTAVIAARRKPMPKLYVEGNLIKRADTEEAVILKGVSTMAFLDDRDLNDDFMSIVEKVKEWKINLIGIYIETGIPESKLKKLDYIVNWAEANNIYIYVSPLFSEKRAFEEDVRVFPSLMAGVAERYVNKNNVIYGLAAEPRFSWEFWFKEASSIAEAIILKKPDALLVMTGVEFGRKVDFRNRLPHKNVIYDYHEYPVANVPELQKILELGNYSFFWRDNYKKYPILVGEFGGVWQQGFGSDEDLAFIKIVIDEVNAKRLSYMAYDIDRGDDLGLIDWKTKLPTRRGAVIKKDLESYPPTDFSL